MLSISHLTLTARLGGQSVEVLRDVSLKLERGKVLGLVGESGAGKSMIGRVIAGHIPTGFEVTKGRIVFDDTDLLALNRKGWRRLLGRVAFVLGSGDRAQSGADHRPDIRRAPGPSWGARRRETALDAAAARLGAFAEPD